MARNTIFVALFCVFVFVTLARAEGTVFVDTVFSSSESKITIDNLTGENAETDSVSSRMSPHIFVKNTKKYNR